jgi:hypothetical protein
MVYVSIGWSESSQLLIASLLFADEPGIICLVDKPFIRVFW